MRPIWLLEADVYKDELPPLAAEIRRQGMLAGVVPYQALRTPRQLRIDGSLVSPDACLIGYGTYPFAQELLLHCPWKPGAWCNSQSLDCATYYPHFARFLLNQRHAILPGAEAISRHDWLFDTIGENDEVFARPTSSHKLFVGRVIYRDDFASALAPTRYDPTTQVVIARPREIGREWRLIVAGDRVIAGCQYAVEGQRAIAPEVPEEVRHYAEEMLTAVKWRPDPVFMLDVCECERDLWLVELNSFSGSWLYACDFETVVREISGEAERSMNAHA